MSKQKSCNHPVTLYFHTHWDREWYEPFVTYQHKLIRTVDGILSLLETKALPCFTLDGQTALLDDYLALRPQDEKRIATLVANNHLSIGPWFVMPDEFLVSGESLIRNLQRGISTSKALGQKTFTGYLPDTFGHSADIPMILLGCGINTAVVWRGVNPSESLFLWDSPNGQQVKTLHLTEGYFNNILHMAASVKDAKKEVRPFVEKIIAKTPGYLPAVVPIGADHLGLNATVIDWSKQIFPDATIATIDNLMSSKLFLSNPQNKASVITGELTDCTAQYLLPGVYSSRMYLKQKNRVLEWQLARQLEPVLLFLSALEINYPYDNELDWCWNTLLLNHPHDSICGCSVDSVHRENEVRFDAVEQKIEAMMLDASLLLYNHFACSPDTLLITNTSSQPYSGVVTVTTHRAVGSASLFEKAKNVQIISSQSVIDWRCRLLETELPLAHQQVVEEVTAVWVDNIAPNSVASISIASLGSSNDCVEVGENELENNALKLTVLPDGTWTILDKQTNYTYKNQHQLLRRQDNGDSYNAAPVELPEFAKLLKSQAVLIGPLRGSLLLTYQFPNSAWMVYTTVSLRAGASQLDIETRFTNIYEQQCLHVQWASESPVTSLLAEGHFNWVTRTYDPDYKIAEAMPAKHLQELKTNTGPIQRVITWQNQALITKGLTEYEVTQHFVRLTLMRAFGFISKADTGVRGSHAGPPLPTPDGQCLNRESIAQYIWCPVNTKASSLPAQLTHIADIFYGAVQAAHFQPDISAKPDYLNRLSREASQREKTDSFHHGFLNLNNSEVIITALQPLNSAHSVLLRVMNPTTEDQKITLDGDLSKQYDFFAADYLGTVSSTSPIAVCTIAPQTLQCITMKRKDI